MIARLTTNSSRTWIKEGKVKKEKSGEKSNRSGNGGCNNNSNSGSGGNISAADKELFVKEICSEVVDVIKDGNGDSKSGGDTNYNTETT